MAKVTMNFNTPYILNGEFFEIIAQEGESVTVRCRYCDGTRNIYKGSIKSTGNFHMHIKRKHPGLVAKVHESKVKAFLSRRSMQQQKRSSGKRQYLKAEVGMISQQMIPVEAEIHAIDLKTNSNPQSNPKTTDMDIKYENAASDENRHIRNLFANAINQAFSRNQAPAHQYPSSCAASSTQSEPTNLSQNHYQARIQTESVLPRIENTLRSIEREMRLRNQIESNRLFLELAKFKYINPDFHFRF